MHPFPFLSGRILAVLVVLMGLSAAVKSVRLGHDIYTEARAWYDTREQRAKHAHFVAWLNSPEAKRIGCSMGPLPHSSPACRSS